MAERGVDRRFETARRWVAELGTAFAKCPRARSPLPASSKPLPELSVRSPSSS